MLVTLPDGFFRIPPKGSECIVAFPAGDIQTLGGGILLATIPRPKVSAIYGHLEAEEACIHAGSADGSNPARVVVKKDGSVVVMTVAADGQTIYLRIAPDALRFVAPWGTLRFDASGFHAKTQWGARLDLGGVGGMPAPVSAMSSYATVSAHTVKLDGLALLGAAGPSGDYESVPWLPFTGFPPVPGSPLPLVPTMAPVIFLSPYVKVSTGI